MYLLAPLASALIYPFASLFLKRAIGEGAGLLRTAFLSNIVLFAVFLPALLFNQQAAQWSQLGWPLVAGMCFFGGQVFTFLAIRAGEEVNWDAKELRSTNSEKANRYVRAEYRKGWKL